MESIKSLSENSATLDLKHYALSFQEKQREAKRKEKEFLEAIAEEEIFKIKRKPWKAFISNDVAILPVNKQSIEVREKFVDNYFIDLLNLNSLLTFRGIHSNHWKLIKLLFSQSFYPEKNSQVTAANEKHGILKSLFGIITRFLFNIVTIAEKIKQKCTCCVVRLVGLYCCFKLNSHVQRLIIPVKEIDYFQKIDRTNVPIVYLLVNESSYHVAAFITALCWSDMKFPIVFFNGNMKLWGSHLLKRFGVTLINYKDFRDDSGDIDDISLKLSIEQSLSSHNVLFCMSTDYKNEVQSVMRIMENHLNNSKESSTTFIAINLSCERIPELADEKFLLSDDEKPINSTTVRSYSSFKENLGIARFVFGTPFSIEEVISCWKSRFLVEISQNNLVREISTRLIFELSKSQVMMSTNLTAYILLYKFRDGVKLNDLIREVDLLRNDLRCKSLGFTGGTQSVVKHAISMLRSKLNFHKTDDDDFIIKPTTNMLDVLELHRLSHVALKYYVIDAVIMTCLVAEFKLRLEDIFKSSENEFAFYYGDFVNKVQQLRSILKTEFLLENSNQLSSEVRDGMSRFEIQEYFVKQEKLYTEEEVWARRVASHLESEDEDDPYDRGDKYIVNFTSDAAFYSKMIFFKKTLEPILDTYIVSIKHMETIIDKLIIYQELIREIFYKLKNLLSNNQLLYAESVSLSMVHNSIELLEEKKVLESFHVDEIKVLYLAKEYNNIQSLTILVNEIKDFR